MLIVALDVDSRPPRKPLVDSILVSFFFLILRFVVTLFITPMSLQLLFLRRPFYSCHASDLRPSVFVQYPVVGYCERSGALQLFQGDPEDC